MAITVAFAKNTEAETGVQTEIGVVQRDRKYTNEYSTTGHEIPYFASIYFFLFSLSVYITHEIQVATIVV